MIGLFWLAFVISALAAYPIYRLLLRTNSRQTIDPYAPESHQTKQGTPTMGGLIILAGLIPALIVGGFGPEWWVLALGFGAIGFSDDFIVPRMMPGKRGLGWKQKIVLQVLIAVGACYLAGPTMRDPLFIVGAVFSILFFANAYNFADGLDGLAGGLAVCLSAGLFLFGNTGSYWGALLGAVLPFLLLNAPPAKVFMGDVGSLPIGATMGLLAANEIQFRSHWLGTSPMIYVVFFALAQFVLVLELILVPIQVGVYKLTKKRIFPATPIHHAFEKKGWPESRVVWSFLIAQIVCILLAWAWLDFQRLLNQSEFVMPTNSRGIG